LEHPLGSGDFSEKLEETEAGVKHLKVKERVERDKDRVHKTMMKMGSAFFGDSLRKERNFEARTQTGVAAEGRNRQWMLVLASQSL
jgi:hypothetical protein